MLLRDSGHVPYLERPATFNDIVEPLIGRVVPVPPALERLLSLPRCEEDLVPTLDALRGRLEATA